MSQPYYHSHQRVRKATGDSHPTGTVLGSFCTRAGKYRVVVELDYEGLLHIYAPEQLEPIYEAYSPAHPFVDAPCTYRPFVPSGGDPYAFDVVGPQPDHRSLDVVGVEGVLGSITFERQSPGRPAPVVVLDPVTDGDPEGFGHGVAYAYGAPGDDGPLRRAEVTLDDGDPHYDPHPRRLATDGEG